MFHVGFVLSYLLHQIHPIAGAVVGALTDVCVVSHYVKDTDVHQYSSPLFWDQLVKNQQDRDSNIKSLALSMRDMLASLSEIDDLEKIKILQSVIVDAMEG